MIIGSGLIASAFNKAFFQREDICIFAAGVSNSGCLDASEFARERERLQVALRQASNVDAFVYFGTCSVADPEMQGTPYVQHKLAMEQLASSHSRNLILHLPQVAGVTPNPHTLLNFLYARISRSESFDMWSKAKRNIIDVIDVATISEYLILDRAMRNVTLSIANVTNYPMPYIVKMMENAVGKPAIYRAVERGSEYPIDTSAILTVLVEAGIRFGDDYLEQVIGKYYK
jgi:nucleoside-diphosphate-sugar epimerase